jgi:hypothetical protein
MDKEDVNNAATATTRVDEADGGDREGSFAVGGEGSADAAGEGGSGLAEEDRGVASSRSKAAATHPAPATTGKSGKKKGRK